MPTTQEAARKEAREPVAYGMVRTPVNQRDYEDHYVAKLVKYIPAEVLAAFIPLVALAARIGGELWVWLTIGIGMFAVVGYSRWQATDVLWSQIEKAHGPGSTHPRRREFHETKPYPYYYVLAVVAFAAWALATAGPVRDVVGCSTAQAEYFVAAAALIMPLADVTLRHFWEWLPNMRKRMADRHVPARLTDRHQ